jgi:hypothetical protein
VFSLLEDCLLAHVPSDADFLGTSCVPEMSHQSSSAQF